MKKLTVPYDIISEREASLDAVYEQLQPLNFSERYEKLKRTTLQLATFSLFMVSFNITSPLTVSFGGASLSVGNLTLFFTLLLAYQAYTLKCFQDEFKFLAEETTGSLKQIYYHYLLCRRAALKFKSYNLVPAGCDIEFNMHGIPHQGKMRHSPAIVRTFADDGELTLWKQTLEKDFSFQKQLNDKWYVFLTDAKVSESDLSFWHKNKHRLHAKHTTVSNHYKIPRAYSYVGLLTTILMIFPEFRSCIVSAICEFSILISSKLNIL